MRIPFLILIGSVFVISIIFGIIIWRQSIKFEKKAKVAKQKRDDFIKQYEAVQALEMAKLVVVEQPEDMEEIEVPK